MHDKIPFLMIYKKNATLLITFQEHLSLLGVTIFFNFNLFN